MNIEESILKCFLKPMARRGGISFNLLGLPIFKNHKKKSIDNALNRLKNKQYINFESDKVVVTEKGKQYLKRRMSSLPVFSSPFNRTAPKNLIVMFDIPEDKKNEREWFRYHLKRFGYEMIQRSVWLGPSPLPVEFVSYLKSIGLSNNIKTFKVDQSNLHSKL
jgi:DNA-binding transcriptional regulator PaaX